jgi:hypothetical protein
MAEDPAAYVARLTALVTSDPLEVLAGTPERIDALLTGRTREELRRQPRPGRWSVAEIVAHLADAELVGGYRFRMMLATPGVALQAYDQDRWAEAFDYHAMAPEESLRTFSALRSFNLHLWRSTNALHESAYGQHQERGRETVAGLLRLYAGHDINHLRQIEKILYSA